MIMKVICYEIIFLSVSTLLVKNKEKNRALKFRKIFATMAIILSSLALIISES